MGDKTRGLYRKFNVTRTDGSSAKGGKHDGCNYFVLDVTHDKHADAALLAYAASCEAEYPLLAADVRDLANQPRERVALPVVQDEAPKAALQRYERDVVNHVGGHYGEEQWQTTEMVPCETGAWVKWSDVAALGVKADDGKFQPHDFYRAGLLRGAEIADGMKRGPWGDPHDAITHEHLVEQIVAAIRSAAALGASRPSPADRKPPIGRAYIEVKAELNRLAASAASAAADKDPR